MVKALGLIGVPLTTPVEVFMTIPAGSGGVALYAVAAPPVLVGWFSGIATPWV
jgi:hypothetical protein